MSETKETPDQATPKKKGSKRIGWIVAAIAVTAVVTAGITWLLTNILQRMNEAHEPFTKVVELTEDTYDSAVWGQNFPKQYESYLKTSQMSATTHGGIHTHEQTATEGDPRTVIPASRIEEDPRLVQMWKGYPFATDYRHARGHAYMLEDQLYTLRVRNFQQPGACLNCHASTVPIMKQLGNGDMQAGFDEMNKTPYQEAAQLAEHPVGCIDCHDPQTMELRITRPALIEGLKNLKASQGIADYDVNRDATRQEMRTYVCAQCHVEYYFAGEGKTLTFPWNNGIHIDQIFQRYQDIGFRDWTHENTGARVLKAQHPEFDIWSNSVHAANGVSCADCHMPYTRDGATKVTDHHIQSPLNTVNASCMTCHHSTEQEMKDRVVAIQDQYIGTRDQTFDSLVELIKGIEAAQANGVSEDRLNLAREYQNKASFYLDYVYSENSNGFHAPAYVQTILADSLDASRKGLLVLQDGVDPASLEPSDITKANEAEAGERGN